MIHYRTKESEIQNIKCIWQNKNSNVELKNLEITIKLEYDI